jgi:hypothetical protein
VYPEKTKDLPQVTYKLIASPNTGRVWLDRNFGTTQVATTIGDSAAYGDYFPFSSNKAVFKGFVGNRKVGEFLLVAQW